MLCVPPPTPACPKEDAVGSGLKDQQVLGIWGQCQLFQHSVETLRSQLQEKGEGAELVWDKVRQNKQIDRCTLLIPNWETTMSEQ